MQLSLHIWKQNRGSFCIYCMTLLLQRYRHQSHLFFSRPRKSLSPHALIYTSYRETMPALKPLLSISSPCFPDPHHAPDLGGHDAGVSGPVWHAAPDAAQPRLSRAVRPQGRRRGKKGLRESIRAMALVSGESLSLGNKLFGGVWMSGFVSVNIMIK